ncbi:MAG TPA: hypothetical protein VGY56_10560 [Verrucomicrobiae bacterium]|nr:hypothetical protein [Verrucomicrobiae bacterium]
MTISEQIDLARSKVNWKALDRMLDDQRRDFIDVLHVVAQDVEKTVNGATVIQRAAIRLTDWEKHFVASLVAEPREFTHRQRECIDELRKRFGSRVPSKLQTGGPIASGAATANR